MIEEAGQLLQNDVLKWVESKTFVETGQEAEEQERGRVISGITVREKKKNGLSRRAHWWTTKRVEWKSPFITLIS